MKCGKRDLLLYAVTDRSWSEGTTLGAQVEEALRGGATFVQLREKKLTGEALRAEALEIQAVCRRYGVPFVINDDVALAKEIDADGVHVGQDDMEAGDVRAILGADKIIGVSAHNVEEALRAERHGADYLGVGAAFTTSSKPEAGHIDAETIRAICETVKIPVIAIGGIKEENLLQLRGNGLCGVAVISAIFAQKDDEASARSGRGNGGGSGMKGAIFDMDGTLLDSMQVWVHVGEQYLRNRGIEPEEGLGDVLFPMSMRDGAVYVKEKYSLPDSPDTIVTDMDAIVFAAYRDEVLPKPGVAAYLESLKKQGIPMAVATATNRPMVEAALARTGLAGYFKQIFTCTEIGAGKERPDIYLAAAKALSTHPADTWVFEDALYAIKTAKAAGFYTVGFYDETSRNDQEAIAGLADCYVREIQSVPTQDCT